jgi:RNA polymerase sigma-70 factor (ECF subfamily)
MTTSGRSSQVPVVPPLDEPDSPAAADARHTRFEAMFDEQFDYVWTCVCRLGVSVRDAEDVAQEVFMRVHRQIAHYDPSRPLRPWLFAFAARCASDWRRLARHRFEVLGVAAEPALQQPGGEEALDRVREKALVQRALDELEPERRAVFIMYELDGFRMQEIAEALGIPLFTGYSRLRVAREEFTAAVHRFDSGSAQRGRT